MTQDLKALSTTVCSTYVEMFLDEGRLCSRRKCLLHVCGDVSRLPLAQLDMTWSAPRMWRCFCYQLVVDNIRHVCSTYVEMFPLETPYLVSDGCLLHVCGDVSLSTRKRQYFSWSAPRMWRCFIFSSPFCEGKAVQSVCSLSFFFLTHRRIIKGIVD